VSKFSVSEAAEAWDRTKDTTNIAVLELFVSSYKDTYYARLASLQIEELKNRPVVATEQKRPLRRKALFGNVISLDSSHRSADDCLNTCLAIERCKAFDFNTA
jgi:hypothetical protein